MSFAVHDLSDLPLVPFPGVHWCSCRFRSGEVTEHVYAAEDGPVCLSVPDDLMAAVAKRRSEFLAGRLCAALALRRANATETVGREGRVPVWPTGMTGSISHAGDRAMAAVRAGPGGLGIDCEDVMSKAATAEIAHLIMSPREQAQIPPGWSEAAFCTLVFSAKEALYKALSGTLSDIPDFTEARASRLTETTLQMGFRGRSFTVHYRRCGTGLVTLAAEDLCA